MNATDLALAALVGGGLSFCVAVLTSAHDGADELRARCEAAGGVLIAAREPLYTCVQPMPLTKDEHENQSQ